ncbi:MAG: hypothetical protein KAI24_19750 [Planctomycetes bacterium]|nr:hypothetical protein [Planctomycetota bacterium]
MRWSPLAAMLVALPACAGGARPLRAPDYDGPPVHARQLADGGARVQLVAPTAGHAFALERVVTDRGTAEVHVRHAPPQGELVAQVVTTLTVDVPRTALGEAEVVEVLVHRDGVAGSPQLAVTFARRR